MKMQCIAVLLKRPSIFFLISVLILWLNFSCNILSLTPQFWFNDFDNHSESLVIGGLLNQELKPSETFLLGRLKPDSEMVGTEANTFQYDLLKQPSLSNSLTFYPYLSQLGWQVVLLDKPFSVIRDIQKRFAGREIVSSGSTGGNVSAKINRNAIFLLKLFISFFNSVIITLFLLWFFCEINPFIGWGCLGLSIFSGWITVFGSNLYWMIGSFFLPIIITAWSLYYIQRSTKPIFSIIFAALGLFAYTFSIMLKCSMGYEFLSTIGIASAVYLVYYSFALKWRFHRLLIGLIVLGVAFTASFSFVFHQHHSILKQSAEYTSPDDGMYEIILKNTYSIAGKEHLVPSHRRSSLKSNPVITTSIYFFSPITKDSFFIPAFLILIPGIYASIRILRQKGEAQIELRAMAIASLFSLLAPLSWYLLAKAHSAHHLHINFILWYVPTAFFLLATWGMYWQSRHSSSKTQSVAVPLAR